MAKKEWGVNLPTENPCDMVTLNRVNDARDRILTKEEYQRLLDACKKSYLSVLYDIVVFAYQVGARQGEILKLKNFEKYLDTFTNFITLPGFLILSVNLIQLTRVTYK